MYLLGFLFSYNSDIARIWQFILIVFNLAKYEFRASLATQLFWALLALVRGSAPAQIKNGRSRKDHPSGNGTQLRSYWAQALSCASLQLVHGKMNPLKPNSSASSGESWSAYWESMMVTSTQERFSLGLEASTSSISRRMGWFRSTTKMEAVNHRNAWMNLVFSVMS